MEVYETLNYRGENVFHFKEYKVTDIVGNTLFSHLKGVFFSSAEMNKLYSERDVNFAIFFKESEKNRYLKALKEKIISRLNDQKSRIEKKIQDIQRVSQI
jgi:hypothetical protein